MRTDYHIHSEFSDDSKELMETQIERAIELGLDEICFTDHVDYGIKKDWDEGNIEWIVTNEKGFDPNSRNPLANVNYPECRKPTRERYALRKVLSSAFSHLLSVSLKACLKDMKMNWTLSFCPCIR